MRWLRFNHSLASLWHSLASLSHAIYGVVWFVKLAEARSRALTGNGVNAVENICGN
jgi:hypothetical protein